MTEIALVHDYLTQRGGGERVLLEMARAFPGAKIYTSMYEPTRTYGELGEFEIRSSLVGRSRWIRRDHRRALPLLAPAFSAMRIEADVVLCNSSGWAHGVRTTGRKVVYCMNPARWLYQSDVYLRQTAPTVVAAAAAMRPALRRWDQRAARTVDTYLAVSHVVSERIRQTYGSPSEVVHAPVGLSSDGEIEAVPGVEPDFVLVVSRLLPYKNVDALIESVRHLPRGTAMVVVGTGPDDRRLRALARDLPVRFLPQVSDAQLRWLYRSAAVLASASYEDLGLTPIEASQVGTPAAVLRWGGFLETVTDGVNGFFFDQPEPMQIASTIAAAMSRQWDEDAVRAQAASFQPEAFRSRLREIVCGS